MVHTATRLLKHWLHTGETDQTSRATVLEYAIGSRFDEQAAGMAGDASARNAAVGLGLGRIVALHGR